MCENQNQDHLNALRVPEGKGSAATLTLEYGPYMN